MRKSEINRLAKELEVQLTNQFGAVLVGAVLYRSLGYQSAERFRQAVQKGTVPVPVFNLEGRRGKRALARDVARWLAEVRVAAQMQQSASGGEDRDT